MIIFFIPRIYPWLYSDCDISLWICMYCLKLYLLYLIIIVLRATGKISLLLVTVLPSWNKSITYLLTYLLTILKTITYCYYYYKLHIACCIKNICVSLWYLFFCIHFLVFILYCPEIIIFFIFYKTIWIIFIHINIWISPWCVVFTVSTG